MRARRVVSFAGAFSRFSRRGCGVGLLALHSNIAFWCPPQVSIVSCIGICEQSFLITWLRLVGDVFIFRASMLMFGPASSLQLVQQCFALWTLSFWECGEPRQRPASKWARGVMSTIRTVTLNLAEALELSGYPFCGVAALLNKRRHLSL